MKLITPKFTSFCLLLILSTTGHTMPGGLEEESKSEQMKNELIESESMKELNALRSEFEQITQKYVEYSERETAKQSWLDEYKKNAPNTITLRLKKVIDISKFNKIEDYLGSDYLAAEAEDKRIQEEIDRKERYNIVGSHAHYMNLFNLYEQLKKKIDTLIKKLEENEDIITNSANEILSKITEKIKEIEQKIIENDRVDFKYRARDIKEIPNAQSNPQRKGAQRNFVSFLEHSLFNLENAKNKPTKELLCFYHEVLNDNYYKLIYLSMLELSFISIGINTPRSAHSIMRLQEEELYRIGVIKEYQELFSKSLKAQKKYTNKEDVDTILSIVKQEINLQNDIIRICKDGTLLSHKLDEPQEMERFQAAQKNRINILQELQLEKKKLKEVGKIERIKKNEGIPEKIETQEQLERVNQIVTQRQTIDTNTEDTVKTQNIQNIENILCRCSDLTDSCKKFKIERNGTVEILAEKVSVWFNQDNRIMDISFMQTLKILINALRKEEEVIDNISKINKNEAYPEEEKLEESKNSTNSVTPRTLLDNNYFENQ